MGAQHHLRRDEEGVLHLTGRVIGGNVEGGEVVVVVLDVRTTGNLESHCRKDSDSIIEHLQQGMQRTARPLTARKANINPLGSEAASALSLLPASAQGDDAVFEERFNLVGCLADDSALFCRQRTNPTQNSG